jgi:hypothetical protein
LPEQLKWKVARATEHKPPRAGQSVKARMPKSPLGNFSPTPFPAAPCLATFVPAPPGLRYRPGLLAAWASDPRRKAGPMTAPAALGRRIARNCSARSSSRAARPSYAVCAFGARCRICSLFAARFSRIFLRRRIAKAQSNCAFRSRTTRGRGAPISGPPKTTFPPVAASA